MCVWGVRFNAQPVKDFHKRVKFIAECVCMCVCACVLRNTLSDCIQVAYLYISCFTFRLGVNKYYIYSTHRHTQTAITKQ